MKALRFMVGGKEIVLVKLHHSHGDEYTAESPWVGYYSLSNFPRSWDDPDLGKLMEALRESMPDKVVSFYYRGYTDMMAEIAHNEEPSKTEMAFAHVGATHLYQDGFPVKDIALLCDTSPERVSEWLCWDIRRG
jgi:hypothetical protein